MIRVTENFRNIHDLLAKAATEAGRRPESVKLLAAAKTQAPEAVLEAASAGVTDFGENFVQEGLDMLAACADTPLTWHFIGHLQSNKSRPVAENFDWVHTIDRLKIAERLSQQRPDAAADLNVCIQVNVDDEAGKAGVSCDETANLARAVAALPKISMRGLMCIPRPTETFADQRKPFARMRELAESLNADGIPVDTLSMGMTNDYAAAIAEGATIVRIGTALFGPRDKRLT